jgi:glycosyltransferase involved in cell wall biosynthesis
MKRSEYFIATSVGEQFGLPALEAMAAGAVVISVPVRGGMDYLRDGENCVVAGPDEVAGVLASLSTPGQAGQRAKLRQAGTHTALAFRLDRQLTCLRALLQADLAFLRG